MIVHLLNSMEVGGVEVGCLNLLRQDKNYHVVTVKGGDENFFKALTETELSRLHICNNFVSAFFKVLSLSPTVICSSLWRAHIVSLLTMPFTKSTKRVAFIHSPNYAHFIDKLVTKAIEKSVKNIFCDSKNTFLTIEARNKFKNVVIVPMNITFNESSIGSNSLDLNFVYVGRFTRAQKNLKQAVDFIYILSSLVEKNLRSVITFTLYGRDDGDLDNILNYVKELGLNDVVDYRGEIAPLEVENEMSKHSFFLQTSLYEGMCITCFQAIKSGLIPVVYPVGEIASYTKDGFNSLHIDVDNIKGSAERFLNIYASGGFKAYSIGEINNEEAYPSFSVGFFSNINKIT